MGLLCLFMQPIEAAAFVVIPNALTNMWQMIAGPAFAALARRLALLLVAVPLGTFASIGLLTSGRGSIATVLLGLVLMTYALHGLTSTQVQVNPKYERLASPVVGAVSGLLNGATGVFVVPVTPYLRPLLCDRHVVDRVSARRGRHAHWASHPASAQSGVIPPLVSRRLAAAGRLHAAALTAPPCAAIPNAH